VEGKAPQLAWSVWGCFLIPIDVLGAMFFGFSFTGNENPLIWRFIQFADLWQIPAMLISFFYPRFAAVWLITNILVSFAIGYHVEHCGCVLSSGISLDGRKALRRKVCFGIGVDLDDALQLDQARSRC